MQMKPVNNRSKRVEIANETGSKRTRNEIFYFCLKTGRVNATTKCVGGGENSVKTDETDETGKTGETGEKKKEKEKRKNEKN